MSRNNDSVGTTVRDAARREHERDLVATMAAILAAGKLVNNTLVAIRASQVVDEAVLILKHTNKRFDIDSEVTR